MDGKKINFYSQLDSHLTYSTTATLRIAMNNRQRFYFRFVIRKTFSDTFTTTVFQLVDCMYGMCKRTYNSQEKYNFYDARYIKLFWKMIKVSLRRLNNQIKLFSLVYMYIYRDV